VDSGQLEIGDAPSAVLGFVCLVVVPEAEDPGFAGVDEEVLHRPHAVAVVGDVTSVSGRYPWWTVVAGPRVTWRKAMKASDPTMTGPPEPVVSTTTSSVAECSGGR
jgi:hypothetical protein